MVMVAATSHAADGYQLSLNVTPGSLESQLSAADLTGVTGLAISGRGDVRDFRTLSTSLPATVKKLDLSALEVAPYTFMQPQPDGKGCYDADELPSWSLFSLRVEEIVLPASIISIGEGALAGSSIESVVIPEGVEIVGDYAFHDCKALVSIGVPSTLKILGKGAFSSCNSLHEISLEATALDALPDKCFAGDASLVSVTLPPSLSRLGSEVFRSTSITLLALPYVKDFSDFALAGMPALKSVVFAPNAEFGSGVLMGNYALADIKGVPQTVPTLFAAGCTGLDSESILSEAVAVGPWAFAGAGAEKLSFKSLTILGENAFADFMSLNVLDVSELDSDIPEADLTAFAGIETSEVMLVVADEYEQLWRAHPLWGSFKIVPLSKAGVDSPGVTPESDFSVCLLDGKLEMTCTAGLEYVSVFSTDGMLLHSAPLSGTSAEIALSSIASLRNVAGDMAVILVRGSGGEVKVVKLKL